MNTAKITKDDVLRVARSIGKTVTDKQIDEILDEYPAWQEIDPTATWNLIVEDLINFVLFEQNNY